MTPEQREHRDQQVTEFLYQLVAELANPYLSATERRELIRQKAQIQHEVPFLGRAATRWAASTSGCPCTASTGERVWRRGRGVMPVAHAPCPTPKRPCS